MDCATAERIVGVGCIEATKDRVYCLGPFPRRVNFTSQQHRALNLVRALRICEKFAPEDHIAIIGGGLAGLTAAAAFISHGCYVDVYETGARTMARQRATVHRRVHPTISRWPHKGVDPTTRLPFLEWHQDTVSEVTHRLASEFDRISKTKRRGRRVGEVIPGCTVTEIVECGFELVRLRTNPTRDENPAYSLVVVAIGFGRELDAEGIKAADYWDPDDLERVRDLEVRTHFLIAGCGDGGLMDALRIAYHNFDKGLLTFDVAAMLAPTTVAKKIQAAETAARTASDPANLDALYFKAATAIDTQGPYKKLRKTLFASLVPSVLVRLYDTKLDAPYSLNAAPIHKLLLAYARFNGRVRFERGAVAKPDGAKYYQAGAHTYPEDLSRPVIHIGTEQSFSYLLSQDQIKRLREQEEEHGERLSEPCWTGAYPVPTGYPEDDPQALPFITDRADLARSALRQFAEGASLSPSKRGYLVSFRDARPPNLPPQLFGVRLIPKPAPRENAIA